MRASDIKIGEYYKVKGVTYGYIRAVEVLKPKQAPNTLNCILVKCEHTSLKDSKFGFIRYYKPRDMSK